MQTENKHYFTDILSDILTERKNSYKSLGTSVWEQKLSKKLYKYFYDIYVEDITRATLNDFFDEIRIKPDGKLLSNTYIKQLKSILRDVLDYAIDMEYINRDPMLRLKIPVGSKSEATERLIREKDLVKLFEALNLDEDTAEEITAVLKESTHTFGKCKEEISNHFGLYANLFKPIFRLYER